jgi:hypothetical protein
VAGEATVGECLRDQLVEAIASIRWQAAVMLSLSPDPVGEAGVTGSDGETSVV